MKRPGKPDTGNPFVRFDEGRGGSKETDNYGRFNSSKPLRLLYHFQSHPRDLTSGSGFDSCNPRVQRRTTLGGRLNKLLPVAVPLGQDAEVFEKFKIVTGQNGLLCRQCRSAKHSTLVRIARSEDNLPFDSTFPKFRRATPVLGAYRGFVEMRRSLQEAHKFAELASIFPGPSKANESLRSQGIVL
jgi:hypothetical protein